MKSKKLHKICSFVLVALACHACGDGRAQEAGGRSQNTAEISSEPHPSPATRDEGGLPPEGRQLTPPWGSPEEVRFTEPSDGYDIAFTVMDCFSEHPVHDNDLAFRYLYWSYACRYIDLDQYAHMMFRLPNGKALWRDTFLYPSYRENRDGKYRQWFPSIETYRNAEGAEVYDCQAPEHLEWRSVCLVDKNHSRQDVEE